MSQAHSSRSIGTELRSLRRRRGLSGEEVAAELGWSQAKVSRIESGRLGITMADLAAALSRLGASPGQRTELLALASLSESSTWVDADEGMRSRQAEVGAIESRTTRVREHHPLLIPGLLQAPAFTAAMGRAAGYLDIDEMVDARLARQAVLDAEDAPVFAAVLDARALGRTPGGPKVLVEQIRYLLDGMDRPNVEVRVLPESAEANTFALGAFVLYEFKDPEVPPVVMAETLMADLYHSSPAAWEGYNTLWNRLQAASLTEEATRSWLHAQLQEWMTR